MRAVKTKSLKLNMFLNSIRGIMAMLFPLITFPYVSRILGVENLGRFNFANSIINYFTLLAGLGITNYAVREGAALRQDREKLGYFADEMFTFNIISTVIAYLLLLIVIFSPLEISNYRSLLLILSLQVFLKTIGIEWVYTIYEDYLYITIRSIAFQILSLLLLFLFVHTRNDLNLYACITVLANAGSSILNYVHARNIVTIRFTKHVEWKKHLRPVFTMFAMALTVSIYVNSDMTVLGILSGDRAVGIYSVSTKIYRIIKSILSTILVVSIPRLSALYGSGKLTDFKTTALDIYSTLITVMMPTVTGIIILSKPIVLLISGEEFADAAPSLEILGIALLFCMAAWFWGQCILVPMKKENEVFKVTVISAALNLILNIVLIPLWQEKAAALTTALAEGCTYVWSLLKGRRMSGVIGTGMPYVKSAIGCIGILIVNTVLKDMIANNTVYVISTVAISVLVYVVIEFLLKNEAIFSLIKEIKHHA